MVSETGTKTFEVLAEPTRRRILDLLRDRERSVGELVDHLGISQPGVSKHLRTLRENGFVDVRRDAQRRRYRVRPEPLNEVDAWLEPYRRLWEGHLDALERHLDGRSDAMFANVTKVEEGHELRYERHLKHPVEEVWRALTDPALLPAWLGRAETLELAVGGPYEIHWENSDAVMDGIVTEVEPPRLLETDSISHGRLRWELEPDANGCALTLTVTMDAPDFLTKALAGWHLHLDVLETFLASGNRIDWQHDDWMSDWERLHARYVELHGAEAGSTG